MSKRIYRRARPPKRFTVVDNDLIENKNLSMAARMVHIYCTSRPDDWVLRAEDVARAMCVGRFVIDRAMAELDAAGFTVVQLFRHPNGQIESRRFFRQDHTVKPPAFVSPDRGQPNSVQPGGGSAGFGKPRPFISTKRQSNDLQKNENDAVVVIDTYRISNNFDGECGKCGMPVMAGEGNLAGKSPIHRTDAECKRALKSKSKSTFNPEMWENGQAGGWT